jgi:hypothetical protein
MGAIDYKTNIAGVASLFAPTGRSYGKPIGGKALGQDSLSDLQRKPARLPLPGGPAEFLTVRKQPCQKTR